MNIYNIDEMIEQYIKTALWSSVHFSFEENDPYGKPFNEIEAGLSTELINQMVKDCVSFIVQAKDSDIASEEAGSIGHDFWLTRNGHGAGFWDGDYPEDIGKRLTDLSKSFGETDIYLGDDGIIYGS